MGYNKVQEVNISVTNNKPLPKTHSRVFQNLQGFQGTLEADLVPSNFNPFTALNLPK